MKLTEVVAKKKVPIHDIPPPCDKLTFIDALKNAYNLYLVSQNLKIKIL